MRSFKSRYLLTAVSVLVLLMLIVAAFLVYKDRNFNASDVAIANTTDTGVSIIWTTDKKVNGKIYVKEKGKGSFTSLVTNITKDAFYDDRDMEQNDDGEYVLKDGGTKARFTHHVSVRNLKPETEYEFVISGDITVKKKDSDGNKLASFKTGKIVEDLKTPDPAYGAVEIDNSDAVVIARLVSNAETEGEYDFSANLSAPLSDKKTYSMDLNTARKEDLSDYYKLDTKTGHIEITLLSSKDLVKVTLPLTDYKPLDTIVSEVKAEENAKTETGLNERLYSPVKANADGASCTSDTDCDEGSTSICNPNPCEDGTAKAGQRLCVGNSKTFYDACREGGASPSPDPTPPTPAPAGTCTDTSSDMNFYDYCGPCYCKDGSGLEVACNGPEMLKRGCSMESFEKVIAEDPSYEELVQQNTADSFTASDPVVCEEKSTQVAINYDYCACPSDGSSSCVKHDILNSYGSCSAYCANMPELVTAASGFNPATGEISTETEVDMYVAVGCNYDPTEGGTLTHSGPVYTGSRYCNTDGKVVIINGGTDSGGIVKCAGSIVTSGEYTCKDGKVFKTEDLSVTPGDGFVPDVPGDSALAGDDNLCKLFIDGVYKLDISVDIFGETFEVEGKQLIVSGENSKNECTYTTIPGDTGSGYPPLPANFCYDPSNTVREYPCRFCTSGATGEMTTIVSEDSINSEGAVTCKFNSIGGCDDEAKKNEDKKCTPSGFGRFATTGSLVKGVSAQAQTEKPSVTESGKYEAGIGEDFDQPIGQFAVNLDQLKKVEVSFYVDENANGVRDKGERILENTSQIKLKKVSDTATYQLVPGWNLIALSVVSNEGIDTASKLVDHFNSQGASVKHIAKYTDSGFVMYTKREDGSEYANDFNLVPGEAYFVLNYQAANVSIDGNKFDEAVPFRVQNGWNLVQVYTNEQDYTAEELLKDMKAEGVEADTASMYDAGRYTSVVLEEDLLYGNDYNLIERSGYFVRVKSGGGDDKTFTPKPE